MFVRTILDSLRVRFLEFFTANLRWKPLGMPMRSVWHGVHGVRHTENTVPHTVHTVRLSVVNYFTKKFEKYAGHKKICQKKQNSNFHFFNQISSKDTRCAKCALPHGGHGMPHSVPHIVSASHLDSHFTIFRVSSPATPHTT